VKKGEQPDLSARWWKSSQPKGLKSADRLEDALKAYETAKKKLEAGGDADAVKSAQAALGGVETAVSAVTSEAAKDKKSPEMAITVDVLKKFDRLYRLEEAWIEDHAEKDDDSAFADPDAYHEYLIGAMKRLRSSGTMNFGFVLGKKAEDHRLAVHRSKGAKALANTLVKETGLHAMTFGTAMADDNRAGVLVLVLEGRQLPGMQKKGARMLKKFKPLPFTKLAVMVDGQEVDDLDDPDDTDVDEPDEAGAEGAPAETPEPAVSAGTPPPSAADGGAPPPGTAAATPPAGAKQAQADIAALTRELTTLVREMVDFIDHNPAQRVTLVRLATEAQSSLKQGDLQNVEAGIEALRNALTQPASLGGAASASSPSGQPGAAAQSGRQPPANGADPAMVQRLKKTGQVWDATIAKMARDLDEIAKTVTAASKGHELGESFEKEFQTVIEPLMKTVDQQLSNLLHGAAEAGSTEEHQRSLAEVRKALGQLQKFVQSDPVIAHLDANPFHPVAIGKTLNASLAAISNTVR
jgi:hypothetical protein